MREIKGLKTWYINSIIHRSNLGDYIIQKKIYIFYLFDLNWENG